MIQPMNLDSALAFTLAGLVALATALHLLNAFGVMK